MTPRLPPRQPTAMGDALAMARALELPAPVTEQLEALCPGLPWARLEPAVTALCSPQQAQAAQATLDRSLTGQDGDSGQAQLAVMLAAARRTADLWARAGIAETLFWDTMGCFGRFLRETHAVLGRWCFDRSFWVWRQTAGYIARLGALEFEYCQAQTGPLPPGIAAGDVILQVHIPSDARLAGTDLECSYTLAQRFFSHGNPLQNDPRPPRAVLCGSWLLAPALQTLLAPGSGIRRFAAGYEIFSVDEGDEGFYLWLFEGKRELQVLPERTALQRAAKRHLQQGGKLGAAVGRLRGWPQETTGQGGGYRPENKEVSV